MSKIVCILSGGLDSTVLLHVLKDAGHELRALGIDYGQRHVAELEEARWQARKLGVPFTVAEMFTLRDILPGSSQTSNDVAVPEGHYAAENMKLTVVPNRNMILLAIAIGHAVAHKFDSVAYGAHAGDHFQYPDCRPQFADAMAQVALLCDFQPISLFRPFVDITKTDIVRKGAELGVDFSHTYSCYVGNKESHCGRCGTCVERIISFKEAGVDDPTNYIDKDFAVEAVRKWEEENESSSAMGASETKKGK